MNMKSMLKIIAVTLLAMLYLINQAYAGNAMHIVINDHLGTPQMVVDENRHVVWQAEYDEFGKATILVEEVEFNHRLPGQYYDKETGLHYNYYRDYDPSTGRYVESDPIGIRRNFNDPQMQVAMGFGVPLNLGGGGFTGLNHLYGYVDGNPLVLIDQYGLERGASGGSAGQNSNKPYKKCREFKPPQRKWVSCQHHQTGQWSKHPRPENMPFPEPNKNSSSSLSCGDACANSMLMVAGVCISYLCASNPYCLAALGIFAASQ